LHANVVLNAAPPHLFFTDVIYLPERNKKNDKMLPKNTSGTLQPSTSMRNRSPMVLTGYIAKSSTASIGL
jgi:hypothetical protein